MGKLYLIKSILYQLKVSSKPESREVLAFHPRFRIFEESSNFLSFPSGFDKSFTS